MAWDWTQFFVACAVGLYVGTGAGMALDMFKNVRKDHPHMNPWWEALIVFLIWPYIVIAYRKDEP